MSVTETNYDDRIVVTGTSAEPNSYTLQEGKTYTAAQYEGSGGAVYIESYSTVTGENVTFQNNCVTAEKGQGAAIYNGSKSELYITGAAFTGNNTTGNVGQGGAIYNTSLAQITKTEFSSNKATMGGAVFNSGGSLEIADSTISSNNAKYGGAIQNFKGGTVNITNTIFSGNSAAADGGAIAHNTGSMTITGATFSGNTARSSGGAICNASTLIIADTTFSGNTARTSGGAICNTDTGTVNLTGIVTLATESDELYNAGTLNWNLTGGPLYCGSIVGYQYLNNADGTLTITVNDNQQAGSYTIAAGDLSNLDGKNTFTLTGIEGESSITVNGDSVTYNDKKYTLTTNNNGTEEDLTDDNLVLTVESPGSLSFDVAIIVDGRYTYNGKEQEAAVTVKLDEKTLIQGIDYTLKYTNNINAGTATVTVTGIGLYNGTMDADFIINQKELVVYGTTADGKIYDGSTDVTIGTIGTLSGIVNGDNVVIDTVTGKFDDKNAGNGKDIQITYTLAGADAANYSIAPGTTCADIEKRSVTLKSADDTREYNGEPLTNDAVNVSGDKWADGEGAVYEVTGSQTAVGSSDNTFTYALYENTNADNYSISVIYGALTVTQAKDNPPEKPDGGEGGGGGGDNPPEKPDGGEGGEGGGGGGTDDTVTMKGVLQLDSGTESYDGGEDGAELTSTASDENVILAQNGASLTISNYTLNKSGDCSSEDNSNFYAVNAVAAAKSAAKIYIDNSMLNSNAEGANGLFASGEGSTIYAYNCTISSTENSSRGLDATYEGTVIASKLTVNTSGDHCAALATDRGDGYISVTDSTLETAGQGSPLIYSTGIIEVDNVTGTSTGSQIAGIEGLSTIRIKNSNLSGSGKKASEPVANGVIIYQSMSGDSTEGIATFEVADSTLTSGINGGAMFYITNTSAVITVQNTGLDFDSNSNYLLKAAGNDGSNGWGTAGANGAEVVLTAINQTLSGTVSVDGISSLDMYLIQSAYTGTFELDTTYRGNGGTDLYISEDSTWIVTANCTLQSLTAAAGASIVDGNGNRVSIVSTSGETVVSGTSDITITVSSYSSGNVESLYTINDFEIDRSAFEEMYAEEEPLPTPVIKSSNTDGNRTEISWNPSSQSEFVDIALNAAESSDEKLLVRTDDKAIELYSVPENYELSLKDAESSIWTETIQIPCTATENTTAVVSNENNIADLFFANVAGTWSSKYQAQHTGSLLDWTGTNEYVDLVGKNKIADTFTGSSDANILFLTDDANGDALFVDDIYTAFPEEQQSRIAQINEIRAGTGDDIVDMTSQRFEYNGTGVTIRGGSGNDTIWANKGRNQLFGDAGNDRIVGASGNDVIAGGIGNDSMHGGGGEDIFCFCNNWGGDTVEQLSDGSVTLWFASGNVNNWDQTTMTYTDGDNTVKVTGVSEVALKFGDDGSEQYNKLVSAGCFMEESSEKIFENENKGVLAMV